MAIQFVGGRSGGFTGATGSGLTTIAINSGLSGGLATGVSAGDLVVVVYAVGSQARNPTLTISDGTNPYTLIGSQQYSDGTTYDTTIRVAYKFMGGTPDTTVSRGATQDAQDGGAYAILVFRGVDTTTPLDGVTPVGATGTATSRPDPAAITPSTAGAWIVAMGGGAAATGGNFTTTDLSGFFTANGADTNDGMAGGGYYSGWTSGSFDPAGWGGGAGTGASLSWAALTFVLRPALTHSTITADAGSYTVTGAAASVNYNPVVVHGSDGFLALEHGTGVLKKQDNGKLKKEKYGVAKYVVTGQEASFRIGKTLSAAAGAYTVTGQTATLSATHNALAANAGSYSVTGGPAALSYGYRITASAGEFTATVTDAGLEIEKVLGASSNSYAVTGADAAFGRTYRLSAEAGAFSVTGQDATGTEPPEEEQTERPFSLWQDTLSLKPQAKGALYAVEAPDGFEAVGELGFNLAELDNDLLLFAA